VYCFAAGICDEGDRIVGGCPVSGDAEVSGGASCGADAGGFAMGRCRSHPATNTPAEMTQKIASLAAFAAEFSPATPEDLNIPVAFPILPFSISLKQINGVPCVLRVCFGSFPVL
jgi:hypothetical protein